MNEDEIVVRGNMGMQIDCPVREAGSVDPNAPGDDTPGIWLDWVADPSTGTPLITVGVDDGKGLKACGYLTLSQAAAFSQGFVQLAQMAASGVKRGTVQ